MTFAKVKELRLRNYRAFLDARLVVDDVTFMVGRNGAGKSTLIDALGFVSEAVGYSFTTALERRGNWWGIHPRQLPFAANVETAVALCIESAPDRRALYGFRFGPSSRKAGVAITKEVLRADRGPSFDRDETSFQSSDGSLRPSIDSETLLFPLIAGSNKEWKTILESLRLVAIHQLSPEEMRNEPKIGGEARLARTGWNAGDVLKHLRPEDRAWLERRVSQVISGVRRVSTRDVAGRRIVEFHQKLKTGNIQTFDASVMSDGALRSLGILLALRQTPRPSIVMFDEIEDSLHPHAHGVLLDAIEATSDEFPIAVSTHNPEILSHPSARGERIRIIQWEKGTSNIYQLSKKVLANLEPPQTVGRLLRANALWTESEPSTTGAEADFFKIP
jgi:predicted ATPase